MSIITSTSMAPIGPDDAVKSPATRPSIEDLLKELGHLAARVDQADLKAAKDAAVMDHANPNGIFVESFIDLLVQIRTMSIETRRQVIKNISGTSAFLAVDAAECVDTLGNEHLSRAMGLLRRLAIEIARKDFPSEFRSQLLRRTSQIMAQPSKR